MLHRHDFHRHDCRYHPRRCVDNIDWRDSPVLRCRMSLLRVSSLSRVVFPVLRVVSGQDRSIDRSPYEANRQEMESYCIESLPKGRWRYSLPPVRSFRCYQWYSNIGSLPVCNSEFSIVNRLTWWRSVIDFLFFTDSVSGHDEQLTSCSMKILIIIRSHRHCRERQYLYSSTTILSSRTRTSDSRIMSIKTSSRATPRLRSRKLRFHFQTMDRACSFVSWLSKDLLHKLRSHITQGLTITQEARRSDLRRA